MRAPEHAALIARVLAIPAKRTDTTIVCFLAQDETDALIAAAAAAGTWHGRRDHALLALTAQTGLRVSELTGLRISDTHLGSGPHVYCRGKGRRDRCTPLTPPTVRTLTAWLRERRGQPGDPVFPTQAGNPMSRDAVSRLLAKYAGLASASCPSLKDKTISPHTLRHSAVICTEGRGVASDATFRGWREGGVAGPAALPGVRRACGRDAGHAVDQGFLAAGCGGCQDVASDSVALDDRWLHLASRVEGAVWGQCGGRWR